MEREETCLNKREPTLLLPIPTNTRNDLALVSYSAHAAWRTHHFFWGATLIIHALVFDFIFVVSLPPLALIPCSISRASHTPPPWSPGRLDSDSQPIRVLLLSGSRQSLFSPRPPKKKRIPPTAATTAANTAAGHCHY